MSDKKKFTINNYGLVAWLEMKKEVLPVEENPVRRGTIDYIFEAVPEEWRKLKKEWLSSYSRKFLDKIKDLKEMSF